MGTLREFGMIDQKITNDNQHNVSAGEHDAKTELKRVSRKFKYHQIILDEIVSRDCYDQVGRPKKTHVPAKKAYQIKASIISFF